MMRALFIPSLLCAATLLTACQPMAPNQRNAGASPTATAPAPAAAAPTQGGQRQAPAAVDFYVAQTQAAKGWTQVRLSDGAIWVPQQPALTRTDLNAVGAVKSPQGQSFVQFNFNKAGAAKLEALTKQNRGKFLLLAINGRLAAMPRIADPLKDGVLVVATQNEQSAMSISNTVLGVSPAPAK